MLVKRETFPACFFVFCYIRKSGGSRVHVLPCIAHRATCLMSTLWSKFSILIRRAPIAGPLAQAMRTKISEYCRFLQGTRMLLEQWPGSTRASRAAVLCQCAVKDTCTCAHALSNHGRLRTDMMTRLVWSRYDCQGFADMQCCT